MPIQILIADDFDLLRDDLTETLNAQPDMQVVGAAASGEEIVALAQKIPFDVLLMDIEMEVMAAGIKAAERITQSNPDAKIIFLTAHETENIVITAMAAGGVDYIVKGADNETLFRHIRAVAKGEPMLDARIQQVVLQEYSRLRKSEQSLMFFINNLSKLSPTERELVRYMLDGMTSSQIAALRVVEVSTVKSQIKSVLHKFGCARSREVVQIIRDLKIEHLFR